MMDIARRRGVRISAEALEKELGVPVIPVVGHRKQGIKELIAAIAMARVAPMPDWPLPEAMKDELIVVGGGLAILDVGWAPPTSSQTVGNAHPTGPVLPRAWICQDDSARKLD